MIKQQKPNYFFSCFIEPVILKAKGKGETIMVEVGAYNGIRYSVGYFFEKFHNSKLLNIEPFPRIFEELVVSVSLFVKITDLSSK